MKTEPLDPLLLSQRIERAAFAWQKWRRDLLEGEGWDHDPLEEHRQVTSRTAFQEASSLDPSDPLRDPLRRWIYRLLEQRVNRDELVQVRRLGSAELAPAPPPLGGEWTRSQLLCRALAESASRSVWLESWAARAAPLSSAVRLLWERRRKVAVGLGLDDPDQIELPLASARARAEAWLEASADAWHSLRVRRLEDLLGVGAATGAEEGWPARLTLRSVVELFPGELWFAATDPAPGRMPRALGPASFLRALARLGAAWSEALASRTEPFVLAHDPYGARRRMFGALFALLALEPEFVRRRLTVVAYRRRDHIRALARVVLLESRRTALAVLVRDAALHHGPGWPEHLPSLSRQALSVTFAPEWAGALVRLHVDSVQRFLALPLALRRLRLLVETHDLDWFRSPRAVEELRALAGSLPPAMVEPAELDQGERLLLEWLNSLM